MPVPFPPPALLVAPAEPTVVEPPIPLVAGPAVEVAPPMPDDAPARPAPEDGPPESMPEHPASSAALAASQASS